jgi:hypothetical protein
MATFLVVGVGMGALALVDTFKVGGNIPHSTMGSDIIHRTDSAQKKSRERAIQGESILSPAPTKSYETTAKKVDRIFGNACLQTTLSIFGGIGRVMHHLEVKMKALDGKNAERVEKALDQTQMALDDRQQGIDQFRATKELSASILKDIGYQIQSRTKQMSHMQKSAKQLESAAADSPQALQLEAIKGAVDTLHARLDLELKSPIIDELAIYEEQIDKELEEIARLKAAISERSAYYSTIDNHHTYIATELQEVIQKVQKSTFELLSPIKDLTSNQNLAASNPVFLNPIFA